MKSSKSLSVLLSAALMVFFLSAAIAVPILCRPFYYGQIGALDLPAQTGYSAPVIRAAYDEVMDYLVFGAEFGTGVLPWSADGQAHFADCRRLFRLDFALLGLSLLVLVFVFCRLRKRRLHRFCGRGAVFWAAVGLFAVMLLAVIWAVVDFNGLFAAFHAAFFPGQTNWLFDPETDAIILILPEAFWMRAGAIVVLLSLGGAAVSAAVCEIYHARKKRVR